MFKSKIGRSVTAPVACATECHPAFPHARAQPQARARRAKGASLVETGRVLYLEASSVLPFSSLISAGGDIAGEAGQTPQIAAAAFLVTLLLALLLVFLGGEGDELAERSRNVG
jgi:hypothetical protein